MKGFMGVVMLFTVVTGVFSLGTLIGSGTYESIGRTLCPISVVGLLLFLVLAARQSRKDKQAREDRQWSESRKRI